jgi:hypothetical protein
MARDVLCHDRGVRWDVQRDLTEFVDELDPGG